MATLRGGCHCGKVEATFDTQHDPATLHPRACDCSFCRKHGAAWVSDPAGRLVVGTREPGALREYRQGSGNARFLLCSDCGVLVAVVAEGDTGLLGAVNAGCLQPASLGEPVVASPQQLAAADKIARWRQLWTPATLGE